MLLSNLFAQSTNSISDIILNLHDYSCEKQF